MAIEDWIDFSEPPDWWWDEDDTYPHHEPTERECNQCRASNLFWKKFDGKWRLADEHGLLHVCDYTNDFEVLTDTANLVDPMIPAHPLIQEMLSLPVQDQCLVHRFLYYVLSRPIMDDRDYDMLERDAGKVLDHFPDHPLHKPGSDLEASYPPQIAVLAYKIAFPELR